ncbi:sugar phosphate isomerase/epimerase family protein [Gemmatimonadota bacterium]
MSHPTRREFLKQTAAGALAGPGLFTAITQEYHFFIPIGVCTSIDNAAIAIKAGCGYIEEGVRRFLMPDRPEDEFKRRLEAARACGLPVLACNSFLPGSLKSTGPEADHDGVLRFAETAFRRADEAGVQIIVFGSSGSRNIPEGFDRQQARDQFVSLLRRMGPLADSAGVTIAIEPLQRSECNFINTMREGSSIVKEVDHPSIRLLADIFHMMREDEGPEDLGSGGSEMLVHLHIAEKADRTPPGTAGDDFTPWFKALEQMRYEGLLSIECGWTDLEAQLPEAVQTVRDHLDFVSSGYVA